MLFFASFRHIATCSLSCELPITLFLWLNCSQLKPTPNQNLNPGLCDLAATNLSAHLLPCPTSHAHLCSVPQTGLVSRPLHVTAKILGLASLPNCMNQFLMTNFLSICIHPIGSVSLGNSDKHKHFLYISHYSRHCGFRSGTRHTKFPIFTDLITWSIEGKGYNVKNRVVTEMTHELKHKEYEGESQVYM